MDGSTSSSGFFEGSESVNRRQYKKMLQWFRPARIEGTPKRLLELLESTFQFQTLFDDLVLLVFHERNRLVEMGGDSLEPAPHETDMRSSATLRQEEVLDFVGTVRNKHSDFLACVRGGCHSEQ